MQYAGDPAALTAALAATGWAPALVLDWDNAMRLLSPSLSLAELPVIPQVHNGQHETLILTRPMGPDEREVLRLWPARFSLEDGTPLWVGNVSRQHKSILFDLIVFPATTAHDFSRRPDLAAGMQGLITSPVADGQIILIEARH